MTYTKYKVLREVAADNNWKVVAAKKKGDAENPDQNPANKKGKDGNASQQMTKEEKEKFNKEEAAR